MLAHWEWIFYDTVFADVLTPEYVFHDPGSYHIRLNYWTIDTCWYAVDDYVEANYSSVNETAVHDFSISPNPATDNLSVSFFLKDPANVELSVYNAVGERIATVIPVSFLHGQQTVNYNVSALPPGLYFARLAIDNKSYTGKIIMH